MADYDQVLQTALSAYRQNMLDNLMHEPITLRYLRKDPKTMKAIKQRNEMIRNVYGSSRKMWELRDAIDALNGIKRDDFGEEIEDDW